MEKEEFDLESSLEELKLPDWEKEALREAYEVEEGFGSQFIAIPRSNVNDAYHEMVDFVDTVTDEHLAILLQAAIDGKGAFRRFKDVLLNYPEERERWFKFKDDRTREKVMEWLADNDIDVDLNLPEE